MKFYHTQLKNKFKQITSKYKSNVLQERTYIKLPSNDIFKGKLKCVYNNLLFFGRLAGDWDGRDGKRFLATELIFEFVEVTGEINNDGDKISLLFSVKLLADRSLKLLITVNELPFSLLFDCAEKRKKKTIFFF